MTSRAFRVASIALTTVACGRSVAPNDAIACVAERASRTVSCATATSAATTAPPVDASGTAITLGHQSIDVTLIVRNVAWSADSVAFDAALRNEIAQALGTTDGRAPDSRGVRVAIALDSTTRLSQRFDGVIAPHATTAPQRWAIPIAPNVARLAFRVRVTAPVPSPRGWIAASSGVAVAVVGENTTLAARVLDARGRPASGARVTWRAIAGSAEVDARGRFVASAAGVTTLVASCDGCGAREDSVPVVALPPKALGIAVNTSVRHAISPYIYGVNALTDGGGAGRAPWYGAEPPNGLTLNRLGGNRWSAYNWRTNASNAGADYRFQNDDYLSPGDARPGAAIEARARATQARGAALLLTVPMLSHVAGDISATELDTTAAAYATQLAQHFVPNSPQFQEGFVRWARGVTATAPLFFSLDNEPDAWHASHREVQRELQTYDGFSATSVAYAHAIKRAAPDALVFGPALATYAGFATLGRYPSPDPVHGRAFFIDTYLDRMREAESREGRRLLDVLDVHYYPAAGTSAGEITADALAQEPSMVRARLQATRSLWDSTYDEVSWVTRVTDGPIALVPRLQRSIAAHYPGTRLALTEYYFGRASDISGGLAQADALGIFGREGVFAAALWPQADVSAAPAAGDGRRAYAYAFGAFRLFRDYDGHGATFGATGVASRVTDTDEASVYASVDDAGRVVLVVLNKQATARSANVILAHSSALRVAHVYEMRDGVPTPTRRADISVTNNQLVLPLAAMSAVTVVLEP